MGRALCVPCLWCAEFGPAMCANCGKSAHLLDPVSVSVTVERLLHRSKTELEGEDCSLSIVIGVMAVESYLTRLFLKLKGMDSVQTSNGGTGRRSIQEAVASQARLASCRKDLWQRPSTSSLRGMPSQLRYFLNSRIPRTLIQRNTSRTNFSTDATGSLTGAK
jgi:hypothetical protein